jgi:cytochrome c5
MNPSKQCILAVMAAVATVVLSTSTGAQQSERSGKQVVDAVCVACHAKGEKGAPRIGDKQAWASRAAQGLTALTEHALNGIRKMPSHGGNPMLSDIEIERAIIYMVNQSGGNWVEPIGGTSPAQVRQSAQIVKSQCAKCHQDGLNGAPKIGDRAAWIPRLKKGLDALVKSAVHGRGAMPSRGGLGNLSEQEIQGAVVYMFNYGIVPVPSEPSAAQDNANPNRKTINGMMINLGVARSETISDGQVQGRAPSGKGYYYVSVSLVDEKTHLAITDAKVKAKVADPTTVESKGLEIIAANNMISYGSFFRMDGMFPYAISVSIERAGHVTEAKFDYKTR